MPNPNDPYSRPINATRPSAQRVGEFYGRVSTHSQRVNAAGNPNAAPAIDSTQPYLNDRSSAPLPEFPRVELIDRTTLNPDASSPSDDELTVPIDEQLELDEPVMADTVITEEDLFG